MFYSSWKVKYVYLRYEYVYKSPDWTCDGQDTGQEGTSTDEQSQPPKDNHETVEDLGVEHHPYGHTTL